MSGKKWGELVRCGGIEESPKVPTVIALVDNPTFIGRMPQPQQGGSVSFTHTSQYVIECLFISSTHFAIACETNEAGEIVDYKISDYSRNGTFLDGALIGNKPRSLPNGAEITLRYKDKVKIAYRFNVVINSTPLSPAKARRPEIDTATSALTQQITILQEEMRQLETKCSSGEELNESLKKELDGANRKIRQSEKQVEQYQRELSDAKERISTAEANSAAIQARLIRLENDFEEAELSMKEHRTKIFSLQDDLKNKNSQLETLRKVISDGNQALAQEQTNRVHTESLLRETKDQLEQSNEKSMRLLAANQALQSMVVEQDAQKTRLQEHIATHRAMIIAIQQRVEEQSRLQYFVAGKLHDLLQLFGQVDTTTQKLMHISDKQLLRDIEEFLAAPELNLGETNGHNKASNNSSSTHITNNHVVGIALSTGGSTSLPHSNVPALIHSSTLTSQHAAGSSILPPKDPHQFHSEDSTVSKRGGFNFTQVPFSGGVHGDVPPDTFVASSSVGGRGVHETIMEVDEEEISPMKNNPAVAEDGDGTDAGEHLDTCDEHEDDNEDDERADGNRADKKHRRQDAAETQIPLSTPLPSKKTSSKRGPKRAMSTSAEGSTHTRSLTTIRSPFQSDHNKTDNRNEPYTASHVDNQRELGDGGIILSQESNVRKTGSSPSKSQVNLSNSQSQPHDGLIHSVEENGADEEENIYTSTPAPPHVQARKRNKQTDTGDEEDANDKSDGEDQPRVKRLRADSDDRNMPTSLYHNAAKNNKRNQPALVNNHLSQEDNNDNLGYVSPPKSFDISRDLLMTRDDIDNSLEDDDEVDDSRNNREIVELREEDRQRTVDTTMNTASRLEVSISEDG